MDRGLRDEFTSRKERGGHGKYSRSFGRATNEGLIAAYSTGSTRSTC